MKDRSNNLKVIFSIFLLTVLVGGCTTITPNGSPTPTPTASNTHVNLPSLTKMPSLTKSKRESPTFTPTITLTMTPTFTMIPTPVGQDAESKVAYLLKTNGNCQLPCWWGITPGRTSWGEVKTYLAAFAAEISQNISHPPQNEITYYYYARFLPTLDLSSELIYTEFLINQDGLIEIINTSSKLSLASMLNTIGVPSQIRIRVVLIGPPPYNYTLILYYDTGMMVVYEGTTITGSVDFLKICSKDIPREFSHLWVWDPATIYGFEEIGKFGVIPPLTPADVFRPLNEISNMQPQSFFDLFSNPSATGCIDMRWSDLLNH